MLNSCIKHEKDDIYYPPFVNDGHDSHDGSALGFR